MLTINIFKIISKSHSNNMHISILRKVILVNDTKLLTVVFAPSGPKNPYFMTSYLKHSSSISDGRQNVMYDDPGKFNSRLNFAIP